MQEIESGRVVRAKNFTTGYLPQELQGSSDRPVFEEALSGCGSAQSLQKRIDQVAEAMQAAILHPMIIQNLLWNTDACSGSLRKRMVSAQNPKQLACCKVSAIPQEWWQQPMNQLKRRMANACSSCTDLS